MEKEVAAWKYKGQTTSINGHQVFYIYEGSGLFDPNSGIHMSKRYKKLIPNPNVKQLGQDIGHWSQI